jgi:hypothetical protein
MAAISDSQEPTGAVISIFFRSCFFSKVGIVGKGMQAMQAMQAMQTMQVL